jgi:predicted RecA/RadA family phage recombinase
MAKNTVYMWGKSRSLVCTDPATPASGDPVLCGQIPGVALINKSTTDNLTTFACDGAFSLSVKGVDGGGNSAVAVGDAIYYVTADTPKLSKKATGVLFGYALGTVGSGSTATITVDVGK